MTRQREQLKEKLGQIHLKDVAVIDWGSGAKPAMRYINHEGCYFVTIDKNPQIIQDRRGSKHYELDITEKVRLTDRSGVAFCLEVLEHTLNPQSVVDNIYDNLETDGKLYLSVPFLFPIHADEDYWRFTEHGLRHLLRDFREVSVEAFENDCGYWVEAVK